MIKSCIAITLLSAAISGHGQAAARSADTDAAFARPGQLVDLGGRRLNLYCSGSGDITVVFDAPSGTAGLTWFQVQPAIADKTRACVYDRAGLGFSDPSPRTGTVGNAADDLHRMLGAAGIAPPYILVGNSYGGAIAQLFAWRHPADVRGLVLVEPHHEDEKVRSTAATQGKSDALRAMEAAMLQQCARQAEQGFTPGSQLFAQCIGGVAPALSRSLAASHLATQLSPTHWRAQVSEETHFDISDAELRAARRAFGDLPVTVLSRTISPVAVPGKPPSALNKAYEQVNLDLNRDIAGLSRRGTMQLVPQAGHLIQQDRPQAVIDAIIAMLTQAAK